ncbi:hypothetical protein H0O01_05180 [Candidatus Micrarchaeota archaeon]|nr:hypothetical protein [Candidatus Micrarchaeota archaeon]
MKKSPGWTYILLEGYCFFHLYSNKKKTKVYLLPDKDIFKEPKEEKIIKNEMYLPKNKLKRPKGCPGHPCYWCLERHCRFFSCAQGEFHQMTNKMLKFYRERDRKWEQTLEKKKSRN